MATAEYGHVAPVAPAGSPGNRPGRTVAAPCGCPVPRDAPPVMAVPASARPSRRPDPGRGQAHDGRAGRAGGLPGVRRHRRVAGRRLLSPVGRLDVTDGGAQAQAAQALCAHDKVTALAWRPGNSRILATARAEGTVALWDAPAGKPGRWRITTAGWALEDDVTAIVWNGPGTLLVATGNGIVRSLDPDSPGQAPLTTRTTRCCVSSAGHIRSRGDTKGLETSMAKKSKIAKNEQRRAVVARYAERRAELKRIIAAPATGRDECDAAVRELQRQPRDASATRLRNRDAIDGRPRGYLRAFGLSRINTRRMAHAGELPGVRKSSW